MFNQWVGVNKKMSFSLSQISDKKRQRKTKQKNLKKDKDAKPHANVFSHFFLL